MIASPALVDSAIDRAFCRWVAIRIFDRAWRDLQLVARRPDEAADALAFLISEGAALLAGELGYGTEAPRRLVERCQMESAPRG